MIFLLTVSETIGDWPYKKSQKSYSFMTSLPGAHLETEGSKSVIENVLETGSQTKLFGYQLYSLLFLCTITVSYCLLMPLFSSFEAVFII